MEKLTQEERYIAQFTTDGKEWKDQTLPRDTYEEAAHHIPEDRKGFWYGTAITGWRVICQTTVVYQDVVNSTSKPFQNQ